MNKKIKKNLPTVTVALSAFNEEINIGNFINSVLKQKEENFVLEKILIISDGSTDKIVEIVHSFKNSKLEIKDYKERAGKSTRLNEIYSCLTSDILIQSDADVVFCNPYVVRDMVVGLLSDDNIMMTGGNLLPIKPITFTEKAVYVACEVYRPLRKKVNDGDNVLTVNGPILGYKKEFIKQVYVPNDMLANDMFTYIICKNKRYGYKYIESAIVNYRLPQTFKDQTKQEARFIIAPNVIKRYLPHELVDSCYNLPKKLIRIEMIKQLLKHPILCLYIFILNKYSKYKSITSIDQINSKWDMVRSTKKLK